MEKTKKMVIANVDGYFNDGSGHSHFHYDPIEIEIYSHWNLEEKKEAVLFALLNRASPGIFTQ